MKKRLCLLVMLVVTCIPVQTFCKTQEFATVLYFNDAHQIDPVKDRLGERGGVARLKTIVDQVKAENPETLITFGGDLGGGVLFGAVYHGFPMVEALNLLPLDIANFGQHDFDFGSDETRRLIEASSFQWLSSNLVDAEQAPFANVPAVVIKETAGMTLGFIGLTDAMNTTTQDGKVFQNDLLESAKKAVEALQQEHVDVIIAITQTGLEVNEQLLQENPEIQAIFSEEMFENRSNIHYVQNRPIVAPCGNIGSVIRLDIHKTDKTPSLSLKVYSVDQTVPEEATMAELQKTYQKRLEADLAKPIATLISALDAGVNGDFKCRWGETNVGNLIADSFRAFHQSDIAFANGGGIRANVEAGELTMKGALSIMPFGNTVCLLELSGQDVWNALEHGASGVEEKKGRFLQISGARYEYDWSKPAGQRLLSVAVGEKPLDLSKTYSVALPSYVFSGGDGFSMMKNGKPLVPPISARKDIEVFIEYCQNMKIIDAKTEGRIIVQNKKDE